MNTVDVVSIEEKMVQNILRLFRHVYRRLLKALIKEGRLNSIESSKKSRGRQKRTFNEVMNEIFWLTL